MESVRTLREGIAVTTDEPVPLVMEIAFPHGSGMVLADGAPLVREKVMRFVCVDQLPPELRERIWTAVNYLMRP